MRAHLRFCGAVLCALSLAAPPTGWAWGSNGERLIANKAVDTLPSEMQPFFDANRDFIARHAGDPLEWLEKNPATEQPNHLIMLDHYGKFPFATLPRNYKSAVTKYGKTKIVANGVLPWQIGVYSERLTDALRDLACPVALVSNEVGSGIIPENALARRYADALGILNQRIAAAVEQVVLMTAGLPTLIKPAPALDVRL